MRTPLRAVLLVSVAGQVDDLFLSGDSLPISSSASRGSASAPFSRSTPTVVDAELPPSSSVAELPPAQKTEKRIDPEKAEDVEQAEEDLQSGDQQSLGPAASPSSVADEGREYFTLDLPIETLYRHIKDHLHTDLEVALNVSFGFPGQAEPVNLLDTEACGGKGRAMPLHTQIDPETHSWWDRGNFSW